MVYYKAQYQQDQFAHKDNWEDLHQHTTETAEEAYKELLHFSLTRKYKNYLRCRVVKVTEEQVYFDECLDTEEDSVYDDNPYEDD